MAATMMMAHDIFEHSAAASNMFSTGTAAKDTRTIPTVSTFDDMPECSDYTGLESDDASGSSSRASSCQTVSWALETERASSHEVSYPFYPSMRCIEEISTSTSDDVNDDYYTSERECYNEFTEDTGFAARPLSYQEEASYEYDVEIRGDYHTSERDNCNQFSWRTTDADLDSDSDEESEANRFLMNRFVFDDSARDVMSKRRGLPFAFVEPLAQ